MGTSNWTQSAAVMQKRLEPNDSLDDFPTPPWATRALCQFLLSEDLELNVCREPSAGRGHMVKVLEEEFSEVCGSDIFDYGQGFPVRDYLADPTPSPVPFTITNPPYTLALPFVLRMIDTSTVGCAVILRAAFSESNTRYNQLFSKFPPSFILQFVERVGMAKGKLDARAPSAMAYAWFIWLSNRKGPTEFRWIAPCRKRLEQEGDYDNV